MKKLFIYGTMALMALTSCNDFLDKALYQYSCILE